MAGSCLVLIVGNHVGSVSEDAMAAVWNVLLHEAVNNEFRVNRLVALISRVVHLLWQGLVEYRPYLTFIMLTLPVYMALVLAAVDIASIHVDSWLSHAPQFVAHC